MANSQRPVVNQRLYFCCLHLQWLQQQLAEQDVPKLVLEQSLGESTILHLAMAYRAYLTEIAIAYTSSTLSSFDNASALLEFLEAQGYESAEAKELQQLEQGGWLAELLVRYHRLGNEIRAAKPAAVQSIAVAELDSSGAISLDSLSHCFQQLGAVIDNQRARLEEW